MPYFYIKLLCFFLLHKFVVCTSAWTTSETVHLDIILINRPLLTCKKEAPGWSKCFDIKRTTWRFFLMSKKNSNMFEIKQAFT